MLSSRVLIEDLGGSSASSRKAWMSTPASPHGTSPKAVRAEKRPPTIGVGVEDGAVAGLPGRLVQRRPGSVTMMIRLFASMPGIGERLLEDAALGVGLHSGAGLGRRPRSPFRPAGPPRAALTCSGSVLSSTVSSTPAVPAMTSGASEEPPMPQRTTRVTPSAFSASRSSRISPTSGWETGAASTQPSRTADSCSASGPHRVGSFAKIRVAMRSSSSAGRCCSCAWRAAPVAS